MCTTTMYTQEPPGHRDGQTTTPVSMLKPFLLFGIAIVDDKEKVCE